MHKFTTVLAAAAFAFATAGVCQANGVSDPIQIQPVTPQAAQPRDQAITLGAGDQLGRACYTRYVAVVRAHQQRTIVQTQAPAPKPAAVTPLIVRIPVVSGTRSA